MATIFGLHKTLAETEAAIRQRVATMATELDDKDTQLKSKDTQIKMLSSELKQNPHNEIEKSPEISSLALSDDDIDNEDTHQLVSSLQRALHDDKR